MTIELINPVDAEFRKREKCILCYSQNLVTIWEGSFQEPVLRDEIKKGFYSGNPLSHLEKATFQRKRCNECGMTFQSDILTDDWLKVLYGEWISGRQIDALEASRDFSVLGAAQQNIKHCLRLGKMLSNATSRPPRVLDFGCGDGSFLRMASLLGFHAVGIDFSRSRKERSRKLGAVALYSNFDDLRQNSSISNQFDAATLFQVLEHLAEPLKTLKGIAAQLNTHGILIVEVPDCRGVGDVPTSVDDYQMIDPLEHINHFTPDSLSLMAQQAGFAPVSADVAYVSGRLNGVAKEIAAGLIRRSPLKRFRKSTNQYFRKI